MSTSLARIGLTLPARGELNWDDEINAILTYVNTNGGFLGLANTWTAAQTFSDGVNLALGTTTGSMIGTGATQKLGFFGTAPAVQGALGTALLGTLQTLGLIAAGTFSGTIQTSGNVVCTSVNCSTVNTGTVTMTDATNIAVGTTTGTKIGTATSQKLGFFNATPVIQPTVSTALITLLQNLGFIAAGTYAGDIAINSGNLSVGGNSTLSGVVTVGGLTGATQGVTLANGANADVTINPTTAVLRLSGPTGAFSINSFSGGVDGRMIDVYSTVAQTMTLTDSVSALGTAANRIFTQTGAAVVFTATEPGSFRMVYDGTNSRWRVISVMNGATV